MASHLTQVTEPGAPEVDQWVGLAQRGIEARDREDHDRDRHRNGDTAHPESRITELQAELCGPHVKARPKHDQRHDHYQRHQAQVRSQVFQHPGARGLAPDERRRRHQAPPHAEQRESPGDQEPAPSIEGIAEVDPEISQSRFSTSRRMSAASRGPASGSPCAGMRIVGPPSASRSRSQPR